MSATRRTRERVRDLENRVEYLEDQLLELNDTVQDLKSATEEILTVVEEMTGQPGSGHLRKSSEASDINDAIGQVAGMLQGGKGSGGLGDLLGLLFKQPASAGDDKEDSEGEAKQQLAEGGRLTSAALSLTESIQTIATTAQQLLPLLILIDKFQETEAFQKLASYLLPPPPKTATSASTATGRGRKN